MLPAPVMKIGTRGSPLALIQAAQARDAIARTHGLEPQAIAIVAITTTGDRERNRSLAEIGGKGLFTKEIEEALLAGAIDVAVHSMKDMPARLPDGLVMAAMLAREDPRDAFLSPVAPTLQALPRGARLGSSSVRRVAQALHLRPDLEIVPFRGNVETRLRKLGEGVAAATFLAQAGLNRLGLGHEATAIMSVEEMLPALAQGAVGLETRAGDDVIRDLVAAVNNQATAVTVAAERGFLAALDGSCRTPIAGLAVIEGERVRFRGAALTPDGRQVFEAVREGPLGEAAALGADAGREVHRLGGALIGV
jgi:hydroxymethylbilane synthase